MKERIRTTISVPVEIYEIYKSMADSGGMSVSRCIGEWLTDTAEGAQFLAIKMKEARNAPMAVMREMQAMAEGLQDVIKTDMQKVRELANPRAGVTRGSSPKAQAAPSSKTGLKVPQKAKTKGVSL